MAWYHIDGLVQDGRNSIANAMELRLSCNNPSIFSLTVTNAGCRSDFNTLRLRQNTFKRIFLNENVRILIVISLKFVTKGPINNYPTLVQIMAWRRSGDKPLSEPMMVSLLTHICVTRPQWVKLTMTPIPHPNGPHVECLLWVFGG